MLENTVPDFYAGEVILVNKPLAWTSFQTVNKLKFQIKRYLKSLPSTASGEKLKLPKIGHAGTLDPLATGLLIVCTGKMTKQIESFQNQDKEYTGQFYLGATTPCHDLEMQPDKFFETGHIDAQLLQKTTEKFTGLIQQVPPLHSAVMVEGKRAYELARKGHQPELKSKPVTISEFEITSIDMPYIGFRVVCSKGTYIRSLARDFGQELGSGAYLANLCRTRSGRFNLQDAQTPDEVSEFIQSLYQ